MSQQPLEQNAYRDEVMWDSRATGPVSCFSSSPLEPEKLAIACDHILIKNLDNFQWRKYNISRNSAVRFTVTCIAWHPKESIIGFGCNTGVVGILDADETSAIKDSNIRFFTHKHRSSIFSLAWAPCSTITGISESAENQSKFFLYSCGCGRICVNDPYDPGFVVLNFEDLVKDSGKPFYTEICWKSDYSQVAVATKNGFQNIYDGITFDLLFRISVRGDVWCFRWHPFSLPNSQQSTLHDWVAVSSNNPVICVYDLEIKTVSEADSVPIIECIRELSGHLYNVNKIDWSPHVEGRLASCSKDGTVQIWDVISGQRLVNFNHSAPILAVQWALFDPDQVISGDTNGRFYGWKVSKQVQTPLDPDRVKRFQRRGGYNKRPEQASLFYENGRGRANKDRVAQPSAKREKEGARKYPKRDTYPKKHESLLPDQITVGHVTADIKVPPVAKQTEVKNIPVRKMQSLRKCTATFFPRHEDDDVVMESIAKTQQERNDTVESTGTYDGSLADALESPPNDECIIHFVIKKLKIWKRDHLDQCRKMLELPPSQIPENTLLSAFIGKAEDFFKLITLCPTCPFTFSDYNEYVHRLLQRSIIEILPKSVVNANSFLIGVAMAGSKGEWLNACLHSHKQFLKYQRNQSVLVNLLLSANRFSEAFTQMEREKHALEAYAISKLRLPEGDPLIRKCQLNLFKNFQRKNRYDLFSFFHLSHGDVLEAAKELNKRFGSATVSRDAAYLCRTHGFMDEALQYSFSCILKGLYLKQYNDVKAVIVEQPEVKDLQWVITIHEALVNNMAALKPLKKYGVCEENLFQNEELSEKPVLWKSYDVEGVDSLSHILKSLKEKEMLDFESSDFLNTFASFKTFADEFFKRASINDWDMIIQVTFSICNFFMILHSKNSEGKFSKAFQSLGNIMMRYSDADNFSFLNKICLMCFPFDILWNNDEKTLEVLLNANILGENIIKEAYEWMEGNMLSIVENNIDISISEKMKEQVKKEFTEKALEKELLSVSPIDVIFFCFAINFMKMLSKKAKSSIAKRFDRHHKCKNNFIPIMLESANIDLIKENIGDSPQIVVSEGKESPKDVVSEENEPMQISIPGGKEPIQISIPEEKEPIQATMSENKELIQAAILDEKEYAQAAGLDEGNCVQTVVAYENESAHIVVPEDKVSLLTLVPEDKRKIEQEKCTLCKSKNINDDIQTNCCLNHLKPFFHLLNIFTVNICNDIFKINHCFQTTQFPEASNFWNITVVTKTTTEGDEFCGSVDDFINDRNKLLDLSNILEERGQVKKFPNVKKATQILKASIEKIKKSCMCPCMKFELQSHVNYILKY